MREGRIKVGPIDTVILLGGGASLVDFTLEARKRGIKAYVFAANRHLGERLYEFGSLPLREVLSGNNIKFFPVKDINSSAELKLLLKSRRCLGIGLGEAYVYNKATVVLFRGHLFDFMPVRLPEYRGGAHFTWQILNGDRRGCWKIQAVNERMVPGEYEDGEIIKEREYSLSGAKTPQDYFRVSRREGLNLWKAFLTEAAKGKEMRYGPIDESRSSFYPRLFTLKHGYIDWQWSAKEIQRFIDAFDSPYPGAASFINGKKVFLKSVLLEKGRVGHHPFTAGIIYRIYKGKAYVSCRDGSLVVRKMLNGKGSEVIPGLKTGERLYTPLRYLEEAMMFRAEYDTEGLKRSRRRTGR